MAPLQDFGSLSAFLSGEPTLLRKDSSTADVSCPVPQQRGGGQPQHNAASKRPTRKANVDGTMLNKKVAFKMLKQMGCQTKGGPAEGVEPYIEVSSLQQPVLFQMLVDFGYDPQSAEDGAAIIRVADRARRTPGEVAEALSRPKHRPERDEQEALGEVGGYPVLPSRAKLRPEQELDLVKRLAAPRAPKVIPCENAHNPPRFRSKDEEKLHLDRLLRKRSLPAQDPVAPPPSSAASQSGLSASSSASRLRNPSPAGASVHTRSPSELAMVAPVRPSPRLAQAGLALLRKTSSSAVLSQDRDDRHDQGCRNEAKQFRSSSVADGTFGYCPDSHLNEAPRASSAPLPGRSLSSVSEANHRPQSCTVEQFPDCPSKEEQDSQNSAGGPQPVQGSSSSPSSPSCPAPTAGPVAETLSDSKPGPVPDGEPERPSSSGRKTLVQQYTEAKQKEEDWLDRILGPPTSWPGRPRQSVKSKEEQAQHREHLERLAKPRQRKDPPDAVDTNAGETESQPQPQAKRSPRSQREACSRLAVPRKPKKPPPLPRATGAPSKPQPRAEGDDIEDEFEADEERWEEVAAQDVFPVSGAMDFSSYAGDGGTSQSAMSALVAGLLAGTDVDDEILNNDYLEPPAVVVIPSALSAGRLSRIEEESRTEADAESVSGMIPVLSEARTEDTATVEAATNRRRPQRGRTGSSNSSAEESSSRAARPYGVPVVPGLGAPKPRREARESNPLSAKRQQHRPLSAGRQKRASQPQPQDPGPGYDLAGIDEDNGGSSPSGGPSPQALLQNIDELYHALLVGKQAAAGILEARSQRLPPEEAAAAEATDKEKVKEKEEGLAAEVEQEEDDVEQEAEDAEGAAGASFEEAQLLANIDRLYQEVLVQAGQAPEDAAEAMSDNGLEPEATPEATPEALRSLLEELLWSALMAARTPHAHGASIEAGLVSMLDVDFLRACLHEANLSCLPSSLLLRLASEQPGLHARVEAALAPRPAGKRTPKCRWRPADMLSTLKQARDFLLSSASASAASHEATMRPNSGTRSQAASSRSRSSQKKQGQRGSRRSGSSSTDAEGLSGGEKTRRPPRQKKFAADHRRGRSRLSYWTAEDLALSDGDDNEANDEVGQDPNRCEAMGAEEEAFETAGDDDGVPNESS